MSSGQARCRPLPKGAGQEHEVLEDELVHGELDEDVGQDDRDQHREELQQANGRDELEEEVEDGQHEHLQEDLVRELVLRRPLHARWPAGTESKLVSMKTRMMQRSMTQGQLGS